jgi:hypothetical protein
MARSVVAAGGYPDNLVARICLQLSTRESPEGTVKLLARGRSRASGADFTRQRGVQFRATLPWLHCEGHDGRRMKGVAGKVKQIGDRIVDGDETLQLAR